MKLDRIIHAMDGLDNEGFCAAEEMLCCFAKLLKECQETSEGNVAIDNMLAWYFERLPDDFGIGLVKCVEYDDKEVKV